MRPGHRRPASVGPLAQTGAGTEEPAGGERDAPARYLQAGEHRLRLGQSPVLMGIVNATPDSFSDPGAHPTPQARVALALELRRAGAAIIDVGGESGVTDRPAVEAGEEIRRVVPVVERVAAEVGGLVSVDTHKPAVAAAAIAAGAAMVNDVSGLRDPDLAEVCASTGAALVITHTRAEPKQRRQEAGLYADVTEDMLGFLAQRMAIACERGVRPEQIVLDPGPDFAKTPAQTVGMLRQLRRLHSLGRPVLVAISRKDFIGALLCRPPRQRLAGTLAALAHGVDAGGHIFRVHDVAAAADFLAVRDALRGTRQVSSDLRLDDELRWEPRPARGKDGRKECDRPERGGPVGSRSETQTGADG